MKPVVITNRRVTVNGIMKFKPCYTRKHVEELWGKRTYLRLSDILELRIPYEDRIWALCKLTDLKTSERFGLYCAEWALDQYKRLTRNHKTASTYVSEIKKHLKNNWSNPDGRSDPYVREDLYLRLENICCRLFNEARNTEANALDLLLCICRTVTRWPDLVAAHCSDIKAGEKTLHLIWWRRAIQ